MIPRLSTLILRPLVAFAGIAIFASIAFSQNAKEITVAADGSAQFKTVQAAIDSLSIGQARNVIIRIKSGTYRERINIPKGKDGLTLIGERNEAGETTLVFNNTASTAVDGKQLGTRNSASTSIDASDFSAESITFQNDAGDVGQAVALRTGGERNFFGRCRFLGWQDTLYPNEGRCVFYDCYIEGRTDFIFGKATCWFDHCKLHSKNGGFFTAAATPQDHPFGFVFVDCNLTGDGAPALLGRPWRPFAAVAYIHCSMDEHIGATGWDNWGKAENEKSSRFTEYHSYGPGAKSDSRVPWAHELTDAEAAKYTIENVARGSDGWNGGEGGMPSTQPATVPATMPATMPAKN